MVRPDVAVGSGLPINQGAYISRGRFTQGIETTYVLQKPENGVFVFLIEGSVTIGEYTLKARDALPVTDAEVIHIVTVSEELSDVLLIEVPML